ncbi:hypothetical protein COW46_05530 [Candidatus Gracilibacteria bacterium CG17_big_fil_post_rev_8_21_14_2_50_48_13]|nr:MAG: hypothetical protein COW46_05530 [Candidatus Gracilibacteria bacterium CG17_big_fil_post_rev_8_21_14_2_50_48_13]
MFNTLRDSFSKLSKHVEPTLSAVKNSVSKVAKNFHSRLRTVTDFVQEASNPPALLPYRPENIAWLRHAAPEVQKTTPAEVTEQAVEELSEENLATPLDAPEYIDPRMEAQISMEEQNDAAYDRLLELHIAIEDLTPQLSLLTRLASTDKQYEYRKQSVQLDLQMKREALRDMLAPRFGLYANMEVDALHVSLRSRGYTPVSPKDTPIYDRLMLALDKAGEYAKDYAGDGTVWVHRDILSAARQMGTNTEYIHKVATQLIRSGNVCPMIHLEELMAQMGYDFFPAERTPFMQDVFRKQGIAEGARFVLKSAQRMPSTTRGYALARN